MIRSIICILQDNPQVGSKVTIGSLATGSIPTFMHIPKDDIIFWFQIIAFSVTIVAGILTAIATTQRIKKRKCKDE